MTNFQQLKNMSIEEFANWLDIHGQFDGSPWMEWFNAQYCSKCESIKVTYEDSKKKLGLEPFSYEQTIDCAYCELHDHCKFFPSIKGIPGNKETIEMWLREEVSNDSETATDICGTTCG